MTNPIPGIIAIRQVPPIIIQLAIINPFRLLGLVVFVIYVVLPACCIGIADGVTAEGETGGGVPPNKELIGTQSGVPSFQAKSLALR